MDYWNGFMNWPLDNNWRCPLCGSRSLEWGLAHGQCRCTLCHTEFMMRDYDKPDKPVVTVPIWQLRSEYEPSARKLWKQLSTPIDEWTDEQWEQAGAPIQESV